MRTYTPGPVKDGELRRELSEIQKAANRADPFSELQILHAAPKKLREGMIVYADGSDWNPGSGEGVYRRNAANNAWVFLG